MKSINYFLLILFVFAVSCSSMEERIKKKKENNIVEENNDKNYNDANDYLNNEDSDVVLIDNNDNTTTNNTTNNVDNTNTNPNKKFYIIGGSFKEYNNAQKLYKKLKRKHSDTEIMEPSNEFNRVVISVHNTEAEARRAMTMLRAERNDNTIWLLEGQ